MRGGNGYFEFEWNESSSTLIKRKGFGKELNRFFAKTLYEYSYPYVPYSHLRTEGAHMADNVRIFANNDYARIIYQSPYSAKQHENIYMHDTIIHPLATDHWEKAAWVNSKDLILRDIDNYRKRQSY